MAISGQLLTSGQSSISIPELPSITEANSDSTERLHDIQFASSVARTITVEAMVNGQPMTMCIPIGRLGGIQVVENLENNGVTIRLGDVNTQDQNAIPEDSVKATFRNGDTAILKKAQVAGLGDLYAAQVNGQWQDNQTLTLDTLERSEYDILTAAKPNLAALLSWDNVDRLMGFATYSANDELSQGIRQTVATMAFHLHPANPNSEFKTYLKSIVPTDFSEADEAVAQAKFLLLLVSPSTTDEALDASLESFKGDSPHLPMILSNEQDFASKEQQVFDKSIALNIPEALVFLSQHNPSQLLDILNNGLSSASGLGMKLLGSSADVFEQFLGSCEDSWGKNTLSQLLNKTGFTHPNVTGLRVAANPDNIIKGIARGLPVDGAYPVGLPGQGTIAVMPPLHMGVRLNNMALFQAALEQNAGVNINRTVTMGGFFYDDDADNYVPASVNHSQSYDNPLNWVAQYANDANINDMAAALIEKNAECSTAIAFFAQRGELDLVAQVIDTARQLDIRHERGPTALISLASMAVNDGESQQRDDLIDRLVDSGASLESQDSLGRSVYELAQLFGVRETTLARLAPPEEASPAPRRRGFSFLRGIGGHR